MFEREKLRYIKALQKFDKDFENYWYVKLSGERPLEHEDWEEFAKRIARIAYITAKGELND